MSRLFIFLTVAFQFMAYSTAMASTESNESPIQVNLPNGAYSSASRIMEIAKNKVRIEVSKTEVIEMELQRGIGPTMPGSSLYMDSDQRSPQVIFGNCKQLAKITCFFEMIQPEKPSDSSVSNSRLVVYEIEIIDNGDSLSVSIDKYSDTEELERKLMSKINDEFYLTQLPSQGDVEANPPM